MYLSLARKSPLLYSAWRSQLLLHFSRTLQIPMEDLRTGRALAAEFEQLAKEIQSEGLAFCYYPQPIWIKGDSILVSPTFRGAEERASRAPPNEGVLYWKNPDI